MGCACKDKNGARFEVVTNGGTGRVAFTSGAGATARTTAETVMGRYPGSVLRKRGTQEIVHHGERYEVALQEGAGVVVFASSDLDQAKGQLTKHQGAVVRERESGIVQAGTVPAGLNKA
ncbi:hypothetical protein B0E38_01825 [Streptomyces sp. 111WW2]|uniref:hypothetical protein n=1 Tax=Streptomyces sp. 111WW2 TaxID=1945515 RepID=UPI000D0C7D0E|nr:hypothetical protein [Streptomyces sp. 111WW2]PSK57980.1 hypothetical protein B0E38_01825 [Streptomyces sp. 111WW2]